MKQKAETYSYYRVVSEINKEIKQGWLVHSVTYLESHDKVLVVYYSESVINLSKTKQL